jgi:hypothetical protein
MDDDYPRQRNDHDTTRQEPDNAFTRRDEQPAPPLPTLFTYDDPTWFDHLDELMDGFGENSLPERTPERFG